MIPEQKAKAYAEQYPQYVIQQIAESAHLAGQQAAWEWIPITPEMIQNLTEDQLKKIYCAAMGWHSQMNDREGDISMFDKFYDQIKCERDDDRWTITGEFAQIELTDDLHFRCGMKYEHYGIGGTAFNLKAVFTCLRSLGII